MTLHDKLLILLLVVMFSAGYYEYRQRKADSSPPDYMICQTARSCARYMATTFSPQEGENISARADGKTLIFEHRLNYNRTAFEAGGNVFEDGSTIQDFEDNLRATACDELYHRDFLDMGGTVVHNYIYSDGQTQVRIVIDRCANSRD